MRLACGRSRQIARPGHDRAMSVRQNIRDFFHGAAYGTYERELRMQAAELNDMFLLLCYMGSVNTRFNYTMTPNLSLQVYAGPFVSTGEDTNFKWLVDGRRGKLQRPLS